MTVCAVVFAGFALLTGCNPADLADANVLNQARQYFPHVDVSHPRQDILQVNTHVGNISEAFAAKVMAQMLNEHRSELQMLGFVGISSLVLTFDNGGCVWAIDWPYIQCRDYANATNQVHRYSFYGTPLPANPDFTPPVPPEPFIPQ